MQDGGVLPTTGFPRFDGMARKRVTACDEQVGHGANASNSYNTCIRSRASSRHYTFEACLFGADRVRSGSSCTCSSWEEVVHVATVVVHGA